jgi:hypothetical protein
MTSAGSAELRAWLARVQHDLVKRLLWPARDRRDLGGPLRPGELCVELVDEEGQPVSAAQLWRSLRDQAPATADDALAEFAIAIDRAVAAAACDDLAGVLALEGAWQALAQIVKDAEGSGS